MEAAGEEGGLCEDHVLLSQEEEARKVPRPGAAMVEAQVT